MTTPPSDSDDNKVLEKLNGLLQKYQGRGNSFGTARSNKPTTLDHPHHEPGGVYPGESENIPTLTETVTLRPAIIQPQPKRSTPMQKLLESALQDAGIIMNALDKKALAAALESRLNKNAPGKPTDL
ncbi:MAG: hypothetical protein LZF61_06430 [Nitrosomonas sp.]|nr:MAG: hypothetical protein LZF61_06430 [Nitrosomonas sp.]